MRVPSSPLPLGPADGKLTRREVAVLLLGALILTVLVCLVEPGIFGTRDWVRMHGPYKAYLQASVAQGRLPLWNPHHWLGRPFLADIETAFFYPPEVLYLFLDLHVACVLTCALHFLLLLYGAVKLSRALGAHRLASFAVAFVLGGSAPLVGCFSSGLVHYGHALCYLPLVFYLGMRLQAKPDTHRVGSLALALGLQMLCGHPQAAWLTQVGLVVFLAGRRLGRPFFPSLARLMVELGLAGLALGLGLGLAAVALLPLAELAAHGNRATPSLRFAAQFAEPLGGWATLLVPTQLPHFAMQANAQLYAGVVPLLAGLGGLARWRDRNLRALLALGLFAAVLAAGDRTPGFSLLYHVVPGLGWLRIHSRATVLVTLTVVMAAGRFLSEAPSRSRALVTGVATLIVACASVAFCLSWPGYGGIARAMAVQRGLAVACAGGLLTLWLLARSGQGAGWRVGVGVPLLLFTAADLALAAHALKQDNRETIPLAPERPLQATLKEEGVLLPGHPPPRVWLPGFRENAGLLRGWSSPNGYSALAPRRVWRHLHEALGVSAPSAVNTFPSPVLATFGPFPYSSMALVLGTDPATGYLVKNPTPDPRAYLATAATLVRDDQDATTRMRAGHDFHRNALVEEPLPLPGIPAESAARVTVTAYAPERVEVEVETSAPGLLVLAEPWFPGWSATVNGLATRCIPANAWMRAVTVPRGRSEVVLTFRSTWLGRGAAISLLAAALILGLLLGPVVRRRR
jgi:hypothetical protein